MKISNHDKAIISILLVLAVLIFFLGRTSKSSPSPIPQPDISPYIKIIDSLKSDSKKRKDTIRMERLKFDSLSATIKINHKKVKNAIKAIDNFTPDSRDRFRDSVKSANGI
ncbi:MAG: hypothetical protein AABY22_06370 [Nanoarchaeota archaeon]